MMNRNKLSRKRSIAIILLAVIGIFALCTPDLNTRYLKANTRDAMKFEFSEETLKQAADFQQQGITFNSTIATAFFEFENSHHSHERYWGMATCSLCINDAMVIFTNVPEKIAQLREHAKDRTVIVPMEPEDLQVGNDIHISDEEWKREQETTTSAYKGANININLFKIWAGKSWMATQAAELNPFGSDVYHWMDVGHFRDGPNYCGETVVRHPEIVPQDSMLMFMRRDLYEQFDHPESVVVEDDFGSTFIPGGWFAGRAHVWPKFLQRFEETIAMYLMTGVSLFEDQALLETTCIRNEGLCSLVRRDNHMGYVDPSEQFEKCNNWVECKEKAGWRQGSPSNFFGMRYYFWHGGNFRFWDPATGFPTEDQDFALYHPFQDAEATKRLLARRLVKVKN
ncbi:hypothetical protein CTEN210_11947 [Chaetoceros tenuissimus]|uniref:Uncharacterized protein n=1 Tax=Chaetoceros tenuissimus TaxID=426638 RepID=A0AAD3H9S7_9STRA|nr:hypothetical protein CTEN210_11947 [Chaetoceros tenuissimus]